MEKIKKEIISYIVYYFVIFFVAPFIALGSGWIVKDFGWFLLPRLSLLIKWNSELTSRIGWGLGYNVGSQRFRLLI